MEKLIWLIVIFITTSITKATFTYQSISKEAKPMQNCIIRPATPIKIKFIDHVNENCINSKIRINEPFGLYTMRDGFIKWETLHRAQNCAVNYFHHLNCNIIASLPQIEHSLELEIWRNFTWKFKVKQKPRDKQHPIITHNFYRE